MHRSDLTISAKHHPKRLFFSDHIFSKKISFFQQRLTCYALGFAPGDNRRYFEHCCEFIATVSPPNEVLSEFREYLQGTENSWRFAEMFSNICDKIEILEFSRNRKNEALFTN